MLKLVWKLIQFWISKINFNFYKLYKYFYNTMMSKNKLQYNKDIQLIYRNCDQFWISKTK